jgi:cathepsin L
MKTLLVLCLAFAATLALPKSPFQEQWSQFKLTHKKSYSSPIEEIRRRFRYLYHFIRTEIRSEVGRLTI